MSISDSQAGSQLDLSTVSAWSPAAQHRPPPSCHVRDSAGWMAGQAGVVITIIIWGNHLDRELRRQGFGSNMDSNIGSGEGGQPEAGPKVRCKEGFKKRTCRDNVMSNGPSPQLSDGSVIRERGVLMKFYVPEASITHLPARGRFLIFPV
jgi:hypothetical protein